MGTDCSHEFQHAMVKYWPYKHLRVCNFRTNCILWLNFKLVSGLFLDKFEEVLINKLPPGHGPFGSQGQLVWQDICGISLKITTYEISKL